MHPLHPHHFWVTTYNLEDLKTLMRRFLLKSIANIPTKSVSCDLTEEVF